MYMYVCDIDIRIFDLREANAVGVGYVVALIVTYYVF